MIDNDFDQFRVSDLGEIEFDVDDHRQEDTIMRLFLTSTTGDGIALEIPHPMLEITFKALSTGMKQFPPLGLRQ
jgi:hypothetical protein